MTLMVFPMAPEPQEQDVAGAIREQEGLPTLRLQLRPSTDGPMVLAEPFVGKALVAEPVWLPIAAFGLDPNPDTSLPLVESVLIPPPVVNLVKILHDYVSLTGSAWRRGPAWIQIMHGSELLAAYPWEAELQRQCPWAFFRIPNFLVNDYSPEFDRPFVVCAAASMAKGGHLELREHLEPLLLALGRSPMQRVMLFLGREDQYYGEGLLERIRARDDGGSMVTLARLPKAVDPDPLVKSVEQTEGVRNSWLNWIADTVGPAGAHGIHFLCAGYARGSHGAMALPESPLRNEDREWSRFVGASEINALRTKLNCQITGFSALGDRRWRSGLRLLANALTWARPGPVLLEEGSGPSGIGYIYERILKGRPFGPYLDDLPSIRPAVSMSLHPGMLAAGSESRWASGKTVPAIDLDTLLSRSPSPGGETSIDFGLEGLMGQILTPQEEIHPSLMSRIMTRSSLAPKSINQQARDVGAMNALSFVSDLLGKSGAGVSEA